MIKGLLLRRSPGRRRLLLGLLALLAVLVALGLVLRRRAGAGPEVQVERFVHALAEAFNAPDLGEQQRRDELSAALAQFFLPEQREAARARIRQSLEQVAATRAERDDTQAQQDVHEQLTFHDLQMQLHQRSPAAVEVELVGGNTRFQWVGDDVAAAVPTGRQAPLELPVGIFLANTRGWLFSAIGASAGQRFLLEEREGQWYLLLQSP